MASVAGAVRSRVSGGKDRGGRSVKSEKKIFFGNYKFASRRGSVVENRSRPVPGDVANKISFDRGALGFSRSRANAAAAPQALSYSKLPSARSAGVTRAKRRDFPCFITARARASRTKTQTDVD